MFRTIVINRDESSKWVYAEQWEMVINGDKRSQFADFSGENKFIDNKNRSNLLKDFDNGHQ